MLTGLNSFFFEGGKGELSEKYLIHSDGKGKSSFSSLLIKQLAIVERGRPKSIIHGVDENPRKFSSAFPFDAKQVEDNKKEPRTNEGLFVTYSSLLHGNVRRKMRLYSETHVAKWNNFSNFCHRKRDCSSY